MKFKDISKVIFIDIITSKRIKRYKKRCLTVNKYQRYLLSLFDNEGISYTKCPSCGYVVSIYKNGKIKRRREEVPNYMKKFGGKFE